MNTHLMDVWRDAFVVELRLRDVPGPAIGDALAQVDAHCAESGESPQQAFGAPEQYAAAIAEVLPRVPTDRRIPWWRAGLLAFGTGIGVNLLLAGTAGSRDDSAWMSVGALVAVFTGSAAAAAVAANLPRLLGNRSSYRFTAAVAAMLFAAMWPPMVWQQRWVSASPWWLVAAIGAAVLALTWLPTWGVLRLERHNRVIDPRTGRQPYRTPWWLNTVALAFPAVLLLAVVALLLLG